MKTIHKYPLQTTGLIHLQMPMWALPLTVQLQQGIPTLWAQVDINQPTITKSFFVVVTGGPLPEGALKYIGTVQMHEGNFVLHVFEVLS